MEDQQVIEGRGAPAQPAREIVRRLHRETRAIQRLVKRGVASGHRARRGVADHLAEAEILEEIAARAFPGHAALIVCAQAGTRSSDHAETCRYARNRKSPLERQ